MPKGPSVQADTFIENNILIQISHFDIIPFPNYSWQGLYVNVKLNIVVTIRWIICERQNDKC